MSGAGKITVAKDGKKVADLTAPHIILATGARPRTLPGIEPDKKLIWTYFEAMVPDVKQKSLLEIGSGVIGIEFASFFLTLSAEVPVVELLPQILPVAAEELARHAHTRFETPGMKTQTGRASFRERGCP